MSRFLAFDAEQSQLYLAAALVKGNAVKVEKALSLPKEWTITAANAADLGRRLKEQLEQAGIAPAPVLLSVGRERVVLKEVKYPANVPAVEEAALIRFQVAKELAEGADAVVVDYFVLPALDPDGQRRALAFAVRKDVIGPLRTLCAAAGLKLIGVTPRPFGIAAALMRAVKDGAVAPPESPNAPLAILVRGDKWGELVILRGGQVAFTRSLTGLALSSETAMLGEIRRNLAVFGGSSAQNAVQALYVAEGDLPGGWTGRVRAALSIPVQAFDPIAGTETPVPFEERGCFAGLVGLTALRARSPDLPINFLTPREPKPVTDPGKRLIALVGAIAAILLVAGIGIGMLMVEQRKKEITKLQNDKIELEEELRKLDEVSKRVKAVKDWKERGVNWLDELYDLSARFPDTTNIEVGQLTGAAIEQGTNAKSKQAAAEMKLTLRTTSPREVDELALSMAIDRAHYTVFARESVKGGGGPRLGYRKGEQPLKNEQFSFKVRIEPREPSKYTLKLYALPPIGNRRDDFKRPNDLGLNGGADARGGLE